jgi:hypothetical protein
MDKNRPQWLFYQRFLYRVPDFFMQRKHRQDWWHISSVAEPHHFEAPPDENILMRLRLRLLPGTLLHTKPIFFKQANVYISVKAIFLND